LLNSFSRKDLGDNVMDAIATDVTVDATDNVYVAGQSNGDLDGNTVVGGYDIVLRKYDTAGVKQWTSMFGSTGNDFASSVATDNSGNVIVRNTKGSGFSGIWGSVPRQEY
jgi:hypothetical protein